MRAVRGLGVPAFVFGVEQTLLAWKHGTELMLQVGGVLKPVARERLLARAALVRL